MRRWLVIVLLVLPWSGARALTLDQVGSSLRGELVLPLYTAYAEAARTLVAAGPDCAGAWREELRGPYVASLLAWRRLEALGAGPAVESDLAASVFFWPDKHGTAGRQLAAALRARDPALTRPASLAGRSAGLRSLAALEVLLWGDAVPAEADAFACAYARAITALQDELAQRMSAAAPASLPQDAAMAEALYHGMLGTLDILVALDLERPLGKDLVGARGERARAWRSGLSLPLLAAALDTVERVYLARDGFAAVVQANVETAPFDGVLRERFAAADAAIAAIHVPVQRAVGDAADRASVERLVEELRGIRRLLQERLAPSLGFASSFNALDGD